VAPQRDDRAANANAWSEVDSHAASWALQFSFHGRASTIILVAWMQQLKLRARALESQTYALYLACKNPGTPWYAKAIAACIVGYALSPIDLIPDFIPVLGYLDDLIIVPLGIALVIRLVPKTVMAECREEAARRLDARGPPSLAAAAVIIAVWIVLAVLCGWMVWHWFHPAHAATP